MEKGIDFNKRSSRRGTLRFIVPAILAGLVVGALLAGCTGAAPQAADEAALSGPAAGTIMASIDGGLLVFVPDPNGTDNNGQMGFWMDIFPKTEYQYSLCVDAGVCIEIPEGDTSPVRSIITPLDTIQSRTDGETDSGQGVPPIITPDFLLQNPEAQDEYCGWVQGHKPGEEQLVALWNMILNSSDQAGSGGTGTGLGGLVDILENATGVDYGNSELGDGSVHTGIQDDTVRTGIQDDTVRGLHCTFDHPLPLHQFAHSSPYYDPSTAMANMPVPVSRSEAFCQNNIAYQTFDLELPADHTLASVNGDGQVECQQVNGNRIACFGGQGASPVVEAGLLCNGHQTLDCQPGAELGTAGCSNNIQSASVASNGNLGFDPPAPIVPSSFHQLPNGAMTMQLVQPMQFINGVITVRSQTSDQQSGNQYPFPGVVSAICPQGFYMDGGLNGCTSLGPLQQECLTGYHLGSDGKTCEADQPDGNYPGCPAGQVFDPSAGSCDPSVTILSSTEHVHTQFFQLSLPKCDNNQPGGGGSDGGSGGGCPPGQTYTCEPVCGCAPG